MIDVVHKKCLYDDCDKIPSYGNIINKPLYCKNHKDEKMFEVTGYKCIHTNCNESAYYNNISEKKPIYCPNHKLQNMINLKATFCVEERCNKYANFNYPNERKKIYCKKHMKNGMILLQKNCCIYEDCNLIASFNYIGQKKAIYCFSHRENNMINLYKKTCLEENCDKQPYFNYKNETVGIYCYTHKKDTMTNVITPSCKNNWCDTLIYSKKYEGYCLHCFMHMFPDKSVSRNYKTKERSVVEFVKTTFPEHNWISDKKVQDGCSKRRPDILCDLGYQVLIIEIDENQHIDYDCSCENKRIMELSQDIHHRPLIFIRFNPDDYKKGDKNITSCWGIGKSGLCTIKKTKKNEWEERLKTLENQISYWLNPENQTNKTVEIIQLFYDE
jgi:hypothetical protein